MIPTFKLIFFVVNLACIIHIVSGISVVVLYIQSSFLSFLLYEKIHPTTTVEILVSSTLISYNPRYEDSIFFPVPDSTSYSGN